VKHQGCRKSANKLPVSPCLQKPLEKGMDMISGYLSIDRLASIDCYDHRPSIIISLGVAVISSSIWLDQGTGLFVIGIKRP
jgi:hypothetical protein